MKKIVTCCSFVVLVAIIFWSHSFKGTHQISNTPLSEDIMVMPLHVDEKMLDDFIDLRSQEKLNFASAISFISAHNRCAMAEKNFPLKAVYSIIDTEYFSLMHSLEESIERAVRGAKNKEHAVGFILAVLDAEIKLVAYRLANTRNYIAGAALERRTQKIRQLSPTLKDVYDKIIEVALYASEKEKLYEAVERRGKKAIALRHPEYRNSLTWNECSRIQLQHVHSMLEHYHLILQALQHADKKERTPFFNVQTTGVLKKNFERRRNAWL